MKIHLTIIFMISLMCVPTFAHDFTPDSFFPEFECSVTRDLKIQSMIQSFFHLVKVFIALITNEQVVTRVKAIEELIASLIQTALHISNYSATSGTSLQIAQNVASDDTIKRAMIFAIVENSQMLRFEPALRAASPRVPDETTQKVISHFSVIVQSFFNIVQDPENSENVTPNLVNMLANIVTIGKEVIKRSAFTTDTARQEIIMFVASGIDARFKQDLLTAFYHTVYRNGAKCAR